jgi:hypothetical protein
MLDPARTIAELIPLAIAAVVFDRDEAPHPPFGHLLPALGEKGNSGRVALSPRAGRGWR